ncbi:MAG TPA: DUF72 domain-containing protein [Vicinamibacterales bacterium]|jgi:uncharacterized protein YecE (DUF72 family)
MFRIGTSGWHYPTGAGTWNGIFYPKPRPKGFDELSFYAEHFNTVEVNTTFYGQPRADVCRDWARRTPPEFEFALKLYQKFTHPKMYQERLAKAVPADARHDRAALAELARPSAADLDEFRRGIEPLASKGKLGVLLAQFPASFKSDDAAVAYLRELLRAFEGYPLAVELRHRSWSDRLGDTLSLLNGFGAALAQIDEPKFRLSIRQNQLPNVTSFYYMRLHGRNAAQWWRHEKADDRYNYLYSGDELREFTETAEAASHIVRKVYLYANNHYSAKSVANAAMIKAQLGEPLDGEYPEEFVSRYPDLSGIVPRRPTLFTPGRKPV